MPDLVPHVLTVGALGSRRSRCWTPGRPAAAAGGRPTRARRGVRGPGRAALERPEHDRGGGRGLRPGVGRALAGRAARQLGAIVRGDELAGRITLRGVDHEQGSAEMTTGWSRPHAAAASHLPRSRPSPRGRSARRGSTGSSCSTRPATRRRAGSREKTGFALEGTRVRSLLHDDGWHDMHLQRPRRGPVTAHPALAERGRRCGATSPPRAALVVGGDLLRKIAVPFRRTVLTLDRPGGRDERAARRRARERLGRRRPRASG